MAKRLAWSPEAVEDIEDIEAIASYIERDSGYYARVVVSRIVSVAESISENPKIGRVVPEIGESEYRERFVYSYRVIYRIERSRILLAAVIHGSRLLERIADRIEGA